MLLGIDLHTHNWCPRVGPKEAEEEGGRGGGCRERGRLGIEERGGKGEENMGEWRRARMRWTEKGRRGEGGEGRVLEQKQQC